MSQTPGALDPDLRPLRVADCECAAGLSRAVGWPHRPEDWRFALELGAGAAAWSGERMLGTVVWWPFGAQARVGLVIVDPMVQRAGLGRALMARALSHVDAPSLLLTATQAGRPLYEKLGFATVGEIAQHQGVATAPSRTALAGAARIRPLARGDALRIAALDAAATGADRAALIEALMRAGAGVALDIDGAMIAFAFCRPFGRGQVIGPVVAPDRETAQALIAHWLAAQAGSFVRIDAPARSGLSDWLTSLGLDHVGGGETMLRGAPLAEPRGVQVFGLASQALG